ncbi:MAG: enoyl-CoA hydratase/isomerase family protein [Gammaproteobacteria bacterium]|nr:MAG: enoyl-CoA hydratase/isomerase family protein [Gammaproteobacteria bacterium]
MNTSDDAEDRQLLREQRQQVLWLTLNRPAAMNALTPGMVRELSAALDQAEADDGVRAIVITGAGRAFCAGVDLKSVGGDADPVANIRAFMQVATPVFDRIETLRLPVIAAVNGIALAGGLELLLCCDLIVADASARIGDGHARFGLVPGGGSGVRLTQRLGPLRARELLFTGEALPADQLLAMGLVNRVVPAGELETATQSLATTIAARSPLGIACMKRMVHNALHLPASECLATEARMCVEHTASADATEGFRAFAERRDPKFTGR